MTKDFYKLQEKEKELTQDVTLRDITILQDEIKPGDLNAIEPAFRIGQKQSLIGKSPLFWMMEWM